jgi:hypothetical protein
MNLDQVVRILERGRHLAPSHERLVRRTQDGADDHPDNVPAVFAATDQQPEVKGPPLSLVGHVEPEGAKTVPRQMRLQLCVYLRTLPPFTATLTVPAMRAILRTLMLLAGGICALLVRAVRWLQACVSIAALAGAVWLWIKRER